ncbi:MAG: preprotein translocase subunit SecG [Endomicrobium sp.]|jgi:preprotein translocase subunit SecG|nr:preprotein translocase subunit SecG [Endomicrobium sp.]
MKNMVVIFLKFIHYSICFCLIFIILLQSSKDGGGIMGIFNSSIREKFLDYPSNISLIKKITAIIICMFLFTSLIITRLSTTLNACLL